MNSEFALAVHSLVLLAYEPGRMLSSNVIANSISVHPVRVRKVLSLLRNKGYIDSKEGAKGGFLLNCNPQEVTLDEIYRLTEQNALKPKCHDCHESCKIGANIESVLENIFYHAEQQLEEYLQGYTLKKVLDKLEK